MTVTSRDGLIDALSNSFVPQRIDKASIANAAANQLFSLWRATGVPAQGAIPGAAAACDHTTLGGFTYTNPTAPVRTYFSLASLVAGNAAQSFELHDRLIHMGGLNGTLLTAQTVGVDATIGTSNIPARVGPTNYSDLQWWLEWYTDTGATASNATVNVTYDDASSGNLAVIAVGGTVRASRLIPLPSAVNGRFIRAVNNVTLSASTGTAGSFGVTCTRRLGPIIEVQNANLARNLNPYDTGNPRIQDSSCPFLICQVSTTSTGTLRGGVTFTQG